MLVRFALTWIDLMIFDHLLERHERLAMRSVVNTYKTKSCMHSFKFRFEELADGDWRAYILFQPDYCGRPDDNHSTHRLGSGDEPYVCWTGPLRTLQEAKQVASVWCEKTERYIRYGKKF